MAFSDLTAEQQATLADYVRLLRAWCGEQARTNNHADALNSQYAQVQSILAELQKRRRGDGWQRAIRRDGAHQRRGCELDRAFSGHPSEYQRPGPSANVGESGRAEQPDRLGELWR